MKFIRITSHGEIDERAFSLLGASSKRGDDSKIGMFGSGLKYSLSLMLKKGIDFRVFSGYNEIKFSCKEEIFRDKTFSRIYINDKETSLTTNMGMDWEDWFIVREIYCNALDESDGEILIVEADSISELAPVEDYTCFYIQVNEELEQLIANWNLYFSNKRTDLIYHDTNFNQIYAGGKSTIIYRKGIRCQYSESTDALFHYDMSWIKINESRVIADDYYFRVELTRFLKAIPDESIIHRVLYNINKFWEKNLYWNNSGNWSDAWLNKIGEKYLIPYENAGMWEDEMKEMKEQKIDFIIIPQTMVDSLKLFFGDKIRVIGEDSTGDSRGDMKIINDVSKRDNFMLQESLNFLKEANYEVKYPIKIVQFRYAETLGQAKDETIFLSEKLLGMGKKKITTVIIEENEHIKTGFSDETRAFQNHLFDMIVSAYEDKLGKFL
jgi:hypothetical protein